jgi:hypothetical protein
VLEMFWKRSGLTQTKSPAWRPGSELLTFLSGL